MIVTQATCQMSRSTKMNSNRMAHKAVVEIRKGERLKRVIMGSGELKVVKRVKKRFKANYGFIPNTKAGDGDCVDVFIAGKRLKRFKEVDIEIVGVVRFIDNGEIDNKIIATRKGKRARVGRLVRYLKKEGGSEMYSAKLATRYIESCIGVQ